MTNSSFDKWDQRFNMLITTIHWIYPGAILFAFYKIPKEKLSVTVKDLVDFYEGLIKPGFNFLNQINIFEVI